MTAARSATVHASAVLVGARAVLIRGPSGAGKSRLALELIEAARNGALLFAKLVGDDRVHLEAAGGRLLVRPADALKGLIELRGVGILQRDYEGCAVVGLVVDLAADDAERLPERGEVAIAGIKIPRLAVAPGMAALPAVFGLWSRHAVILAFQRPVIAVRAPDWRLINHNSARVGRRPAFMRARILAALAGRARRQRASLTAMQQTPQHAKNAPCAGALDGHDVHPFVRRNRDAPAGSSMIGLVLVTHGRLAIEFRAALEHVVGPQAQIEAITIGPDDDVEARRKDIIEAVRRVDSGDGVAILTDMFGGTPSNLAISVMSRPKVEVLAGINLPMLVKLAKVRDECPLADAVAAAQEAGRKYVTIASRVLSGK